MNKQALSFSRKDPAKFFKTLNKRVNEYFKENNLENDKFIGNSIPGVFFSISLSTCCSEAFAQCKLS